MRYVHPPLYSALSFVVILNAIETILSLCTAASSITQNKSSKLTYQFNHHSAEQADIQKDANEGFNTISTLDACILQKFA